jgi:hypothetical protein
LLKDPRKNDLIKCPHCKRELTNSRGISPEKLINFHCGATKCHLKRRSEKDEEEG